MHLEPTWQEIVARVGLAALFSLLIGFNRDEYGHPAGVRTTMLVCLAATLAQIQANVLLTTAGKTSSSFSVLDLERLPLGILSGIGFIGAGVIVKRDPNTISGVTTAATIWFVTVLGLLFGGGQLILGTAGSLVALVILWFVKRVESVVKKQRSGTLRLSFSSPPDEIALRRHLKRVGCEIRKWHPTYMPPGAMTALSCELAWFEQAGQEPNTPSAVLELGTFSEIVCAEWDE